MPTLREKQSKFALAAARLILWLSDHGYAVTLAEAYRTPEQAAINAAKGTGIRASLHCIRLAIDINIFKEGRLITDSSELENVGLYWESIGGSWGGRFGDGNHFSFSHEGRR